jgi:nucleoside-diphosphate-sugar epimerase
MRVLVTGAGGVLGGAIARHLAAAGHEVVGHGRRPTGLADELVADLATPGFAALAAARLAPCEAVVHAAASLDLSPHAPGASLTNGLGTQQVLETAARWRSHAFVYLSSIGVIGVPREHPVREEHPAAPLTDYHASKLYGEHLVAVASRKGLRGVSLRVTSPVGPGMRRDGIFATFVGRALRSEPLFVAGRGTRRQNYVDVRDVARQVEACLASGASGIFNAAGAEAVSNLDLARECQERLGSTAGIALGGDDEQDHLSWDVSMEKAERCLAFRPRYARGASIDALARELREESPSTVEHAPR